MRKRLWAIAVVGAVLSLWSEPWLGKSGAVLAADAGAAVPGPVSPNLGPGEPFKDKVRKTCSAVTVTSAQLVRRDGNVVLKVSGTAPYAGMVLEVRPVVYVMQPDYWLMTLVGCTPAGTVSAAVITPFETEVNVHGSVGRKGIDLSVDASDKALRLELPA